MSLPALQALRSAHPHAHIAIQARPWVADLYAREPFCDQIILHTAQRGWRDFRGKWQVAQQLRSQGFDMAILLQNAFEAAVIALAAGIPRRIGYERDGRGLLLTDAVQLPQKGDIHEHERYYYLELLRRAKLIPGYPDEVAITLQSAPKARESGLRLLAERGIEGPVIGVAPGAAYGGAKRWLPERFAEAAAQLSLDLKATVALFGSDQERAVGEEIAGFLREMNVPVMNFAGSTTLAQFIDMAAACTVFLTNDSGPMHVATALGVPVVAVFGPTNEYTTGPAGRAARVIREPVDCAPCMLRECPIDHRCMTRVESQRVVDAALELVKIR